MLGPATVKRAVKRASGWAAIVSNLLSENVRQPAATIFYYHRIARLEFADPQIDDHNVTPEDLERHIQTLSELAEIVPLPDLPHRLRCPETVSKPLVCLTFDDGYGNFFTNALPILKRYNAPATLSVVTKPIDLPEPMPFDKWAIKNISRVSPDSWRPIKWREIDSSLASGLVTLGAHSHEHLNAARCSRQQIYDEVGHSAEILHGRYGRSNVPVYAYPYGNPYLGHVPQDYETAVYQAGFKLAVTTHFGQVFENLNPYLLPRVEAHALDSPATLRAKVVSKYSPFYFHDYCRAATYALKNRRKTKTLGAGRSRLLNPFRSNTTIG